MYMLLSAVIEKESRTFLQIVDSEYTVLINKDRQLYFESKCDPNELDSQLKFPIFHQIYSGIREGLHG